MKARTIELWVGLFMLLGICSLLMLALQVSGLGNIYDSRQSYSIKAEFTNIGGLKEKSKVTISGVTIGRVVAIRLNEDATYGEYKAEVEMKIYSDIDQIPADSEAKILTSGLLGDNYIGIVPGQDEQYLKDGDNIALTSQALLLEDLISKFAVGSK